MYQEQPGYKLMFNTLRAIFQAPDTGGYRW